MIKQLTLLGTALAMSIGALLPATAADAQRYRGPSYDQSYARPDYRGNDDSARYRAPKRCSDGTAGAIIGAIAGGLLGRTIDRGGDRSAGTLLGAGGGALAGRAIERSGSRQAAQDGRCYR